MAVSSSCKGDPMGMDNGKYVRFTPEQVEALERLYHDCPVTGRLLVTLCLCEQHFSFGSLIFFGKRKRQGALSISFIKKKKFFGGKQEDQKMSTGAPPAAPEEEDGSSSEEEEVKKEIRKEHYSSSHKILLVGEGDFSFSLCLARAFGSARNIVATTVDTHQELAKKYSNAIENLIELQQRGCVVLCGVDATTMSNHFFLTTQRFHRIVYNFPHVGFSFPEDNGCQIMLNKELVKGFMRNAKVLLKKENGEIHVTHKLGEPYDKWDLVKEAKKIGLVNHNTKPFFKDRYPGYAQKRAHGSSPDEPFNLGGSSTFMFRPSG
ncbi:hypothetical protein L2E82_15412 [Cichorium intybus]|uniref:Uncharacterized protein n=1 Tax=Cichorium intybus TaxID=13427 RepID=A0ACB9F2R0_CICIN|nr:hypothetical protein L2E82_15412 [Cichorium intybus]